MKYFRIARHKNLYLLISEQIVINVIRITCYYYLHKAERSWALLCKRCLPVRLRQPHNNLARLLYSTKAPSMS